MSNFKNSNFKLCTLRINIEREKVCNLVKKLKRNPEINYVTIEGKICDCYTIQTIMCSLKAAQVEFLDFSNNEINSNCAKYLAHGLQGSYVTHLTLFNCQIDSTGIKYIANILKDTNISYLNLQNNNIKDDGITYLAERLKNTSLLHLNAGSNNIGTDGIKSLADFLQYTNITSLSLQRNFLQGDSYQKSDEAVKYLGKHLKNTCITNLSLTYNNISCIGARSLVQDLNDSQVTELDFISKHEDYYTVTIANRVTSKNKIMASKIQNAFQKLVVQNVQNNNLEFIIPAETENLDMEEYLFIVKTLQDTPNVKGHIFDMIRNSITYPNIIRKTNEFVITISEKFNTFFNNKLIELSNIFEGFNYMDFVKQCDDMRLDEVVKNLLLHRELYYVDDDQEILHPYIYKMLIKYGMPLYIERIEPKKRDNIISYYRSHLEIDGAQDIIDLLV